VTEVYRTGKLRQRLQKHHGPNVDCAFWGWADTWLHADFARWNLEEYLASIHVPLLVIQGEDDEYGMAAVGVIPRQAGAGAEVLMLPECGHAPHRDQEEATLAAMARFIRGIREGG
jgi:pimeloyl-ACP methyl ester carboxylesterase